jgi:hypothetical protein
MKVSLVGRMLTPLAACQESLDGMAVNATHPK